MEERLALLRRMCPGMGLPRGFLRWIWERRPVPVIPARMGACPTVDETPSAINADVVPVPEVRCRDIDRARIRFAVPGPAGPWMSDRPAGIGIFPRRPAGTVGPDPGGAPACPDPLPPLFGHALTRGGDQCRIDGPTASGPVPPIPKPVLECRRQCPEYAGPGRLLKQPDRLSIRGRSADPETRKPQPTQAVAAGSSIRPSPVLCMDAGTGTLNIVTGSQGGRPPFGRPP